MNNKKMSFMFGFMMVVMSSFVGATVSSPEEYLKAHELYKQSKFQESYDAYAKIAHKSPQVYYNLGNCAFKLGQLGNALLQWRRAEVDWGFFNRHELLENIALVQKKLDEKANVKQAKKGSFGALFVAIKSIKERFLSMIRSIPLFILQLLFLLVWCFLFLCLRYLNKSRQRFILVVLFILNGFFGTMLALKYNMSIRSYGVVVVEKASLISGPDETFQVLGVLHEGKEGVILKESGTYYKVKINGQLGWVTKEAFQQI